MGMFDGIGSNMFDSIQRAKDKAKGLMFKQDQAKQQVNAQTADINNIVNAQSPAQMGQYQGSDYSQSGSSVAGLQSSAAKLGYMQANEANKELERLRPQQLQFANQLAAGALGQGPSLAEAQMKATNERTLAQQLAAAKSARNVNPALAQRNIGNIAAQQNMALAQNTGMAKLQEQQQKQQMFNNYLQQQNQGVLQGGSAGSQAAAQAGATRAAGQQQQNALLGTALQTGGSIAGMMIGGPAGAAVGNQLGGAIAGGGDSSNAFQQKMTPGMAHGGLVPGPEYFKGDSIKNDVVDAKLSAGEIVVPKSVAQGSKKDIMSFIEKIAQDKQKKPTEPKNKKGFESVVKAVKGGK